MVVAVTVAITSPTKIMRPGFRLSPLPTYLRRRHATFCTLQEEEQQQRASNESKNKTIFVAGAAGNTGKRIVSQLVKRGFSVRAGVLDVERAKNTLPVSQSIDIVNADVRDGAAKLSEAIDGCDAVICATGFRYSLDFLAPWKVDYFGTVNLVDACRSIGVNRFVLISSILVNGAAVGQIFNPAYIVLNTFGLTLIAKLQAEQYIRKSGINFTIIRPGGLRNDPPSGNLVMESEDTLFAGSISRDQVAEVAVEALLYPEASYKVVEIISRPDAPRKSLQELFSVIK